MNSDKNLTFYIVRHGQSMGNIPNSGVPFDELNPPLTELGKIQSERLSERFEQGSLDRIFCSPLDRAINTVNPIAEKLRLNVTLLSGLVEKGTSDSLCIDYPGDSETEEETFFRAKKIIEEIISMCEDGENILIGTHGTFLSYIVRAFLKIQDKTFRIKCDNTAVTVISVYRDEMIKLCYLNDVRHLKPEEIS